MKPSIAVVHLIWGPLGIEPVKQFSFSYAKHPAGIAHRVVLALNDVVSLPMEVYGAELINVPKKSFDISAYLYAAEAIEADFFCFLNSYSQILCDDWLAKLHQHASRADVGAVGSTGSWESQLTAWGLRGYAAFPNAHLRTNAFMLRRDILLGLNLPKIRAKADTHLFESGLNGMSCQLQRAGLKLLVVGRDGRGYEPDEWKASYTYRAGVQQNLLVSDSRTRDYQYADRFRQEWLSELAWGKALPGKAAAAQQSAGGC